MKTARNLKQITDADLIKRFVEIGVEQDDALNGPSVARYNRLFREKVAIVEELRVRGDDHRRLLFSLYDHENVQVRLNAAKATIAIDYNAARRLLEAIAASSYSPQYGNAGMSLWALDEGIFKPK